jgi:hypothetical protein
MAIMAITTNSSIKVKPRDFISGTIAEMRPGRKHAGAQNAFNLVAPFSVYGLTIS